MTAILLISDKNFDHHFQTLPTFQFHWTNSKDDVLEWLWDEPSAVIIDIEMNPLQSCDALTLIKEIRKKDPLVSIILGVTSHLLTASTLPYSLELIKAGASQFIQFPAPQIELLWFLNKAVEHTIYARKAVHYSVKDLKYNNALREAIQRYLELSVQQAETGIPLTIEAISSCFPNELSNKDSISKALETASQKSSKDFTILIVDDERDFREKLINLFSPSFTIKEAETVHQAFEILKETSIDLILLDITLPEKRGTEAVKELKKQYPFTEIIMLTAHSDFGLLAATITDGATDYVLKPFNKTLLKHSIQRALQLGIFKKITAAV